MLQSKKEAFPLHIKIDNESEFQKLSVFDGKNQLVHEKIGKLDSIELPRGLYRIEVELTGQIQSNVVRHVKKSIHEIKLPEQYSSIPFIGYSSSTAYYTEAAYTHSRTTTCKPKRIPEVTGSNSLFVMLRFPNSDIYKKLKTKDTFKGFSLINYKKKHIVTLNDDNCKIDRSNGSLAFCIKLPVGQYYLRYKGQYPREIPIYIHDYWQMQLFMTVTTEPLFSSAKLLMSRHMGFNAESSYNKAIDVALLKLQNGDYQISKALRERFAYDKWDNPIMGIIGIYLYLLSGSSDDNQLYKAIMSNLTGQIHLDANSPDMKILRLMSNEHHGKVIQEVQFEHPPMFIAGYKEIINRSSSDSALIKEESYIDKSSAKLFWDSPITSYAYESEPKTVSILDNIGSAKLSTVLATLQESDTTAKIVKGKGKITTVDTDVDWVVPSILKSAITQEDSEQPISVEQIAKDLELPQITIKRNISNLLASMKQSSDSASNIFGLLNTMTSEVLTDSKSVIDFLDELQNKTKEGDVINQSGIIRTDRKKKMWK